MNLLANGMAAVFTLTLFFFSPENVDAHGFAARTEKKLGIDLLDIPRVEISSGMNNSTNWAHPDVGCIEDFIPKFLACLDLTTIKNPIADFPADLNEAQVKYWTVDHRADLNLCRAKEVDRREKLVPGSMSAPTIAWAWMWNKQSENIAEKIKATYETAAKVEMPPQILFGALKQESLLSDLGITEDGGNYSCGVGQINVGEWCRYMGSLSESEQAQLEWPQGISCTPETLPSELTKPFYDIALGRLGSRPDYELTPKEFSGILFSDVVSSFPSADDELQKLRFSAVSSFVKNCSTSGLGIAAKGKILQGLFLKVPSGLRNAQKYSNGTTFSHSCEQKYRSPYYPLHTGWLLADAIYNAGEREISVLQYYFRMTATTHESGVAWKKLTPPDLIEGLHWGGKWSPKTRKIEYKNVYGESASQSWFKSCVVQRHIARVIQYVTSPGAVIANSLEVGGCSLTEVPEYRKMSSGKKPKKR